MSVDEIYAIAALASAGATAMRSRRTQCLRRATHPMRRCLRPLWPQAAWSANAQDGDVAAGRTFAREACNSCHVVEPTNPPPRIVVIGPNFQDIANTKGMTATALRVFLTTSHPKMPNLILAPEQITDVIAYILSLRERC